MIMKRLIYFTIFFTLSVIPLQSQIATSISNWINTDYVACLKNNLPCQCENEVQGYIAISILPNYSKTRTGNYYVAIYTGMIECNFYFADRVQEGTYVLYKAHRFYEERTNDVAEVWGEMREVDDRLILYDLRDNQYFTFIKSNIESDSSYPEFFLGYENVKYMNEAFTSRGHPPLEEIIKMDSLSCDCNHWMRGTNLVTIWQKPYAWILELDSGYLKIEEEINLYRDPLDPVETRLLYKAKWDKAE